VYGASVENGSMAHYDAIANGQGEPSSRYMQHAMVLNVHGLADGYRVHVPTNDSIKPEITFFPYFYIAQDNHSRRQKRAICHPWPDSFVLVDHGCLSQDFRSNIRHL
jgi:hypothetical protein